MTLAESKEKYPEIEKMYLLIEKKGLRFEILPEAKELSAASFKMISVKSSTGNYVVPADDEYKDSDSGNPALLLQLVIFALEEYEDCEDYLIWSTAYGLDSTNPVHLDWYRQLGLVAPKMRKLVGVAFSGISDFDWQLNAGAAQALRELSE